MAELFPHEDTTFFKAALETKANKTDFDALLIEKDYFCSLILRILFTESDGQLVFKGGTLLNKVHMGFYRLSEDLDFSIPVNPGISRKERSHKIQPLKPLAAMIASKIPGISLTRPLTGSNNSTQYNATFEYDSVLENTKGTILFEVGLREELLEPVMEDVAQTLITDPFNDEKLISPFLVKCLSKKEAYAEKMRAALSRLHPAIRDLFDIDYALNNQQLDVNNPTYKNLVKLKLAKPEQRVINLSDEKKHELMSQVQMHLKPVLRSKDFNRFDFESAWQRLCRIGAEYQG